MNSKEMAILAAKVLNSKKGEDIKIIDVSSKSSFTDFLILASGGSDRQVNALADEVEDAFAEQGMTVSGIEGKNGSGWILIDLGDIVVNVFTRDMRSKYSIEKVWGDCAFIEPEE